MDEHKILHINNSSMLFTYIEITISFFLLTSTLPQFHCDQPPPQSHSVDDYLKCQDQPYNCGPELQDIFYPFWGDNRPKHCGGGDDLFKLNCDRDQNTTTILIGSQNFTVLDINSNDHTIKMMRTDLDNDVCSPQFNDTYLSPTLFGYDPRVGNITIFYNCSAKGFPYFNCGPPHSHSNTVCYAGAEDKLFEEIPDLKSCERHIHVPVGFPLEPYYYYYTYGKEVKQEDLGRGLNEGFEVKSNVNEECVRCLGSAGRCWNTTDIDDIKKLVRSSCYYSYCPADGSIVSAATNCPVLNAPHKSRKQLNRQEKIILGSAGAAFVGLLICITIFCFKYKSSTWHAKFWLTAKSNQDVEAFLKSQGPFALRRYKFSDIKKMTSNFKVKLGQGGYGVVYKGKLLNNDGPVAVKILNLSKRNIEQQFINEVASISRTSHVNVVSLLGFCLEGNKKALIYEFVSNGSLDKFICNQLGPETFASLSWESVYQIAIGIARGLEYLHKGCNTRILHFDIKPHNILLDENFCPKISDFGLAKLYPRKESIISMSDARGTMGYIAPEVWNRRFGRVSHKSDVYSYGMMLLEMMGERENINAKVSLSSEKYFPDWIYEKLELGNDSRPEGVMATKENEIIRKMTIVGLWCIQTIPNDRPTMSIVIDMLEGSINSLEIPPKHVFSSPTRSPPESSTS